MRSQLVLRSSNQGTGWSDSWAFSGRDESLLRNYLAQLDQYATPVPLERWDPQKRMHVSEAEDRWLAAMLLFSQEEYRKPFYVDPVIEAEAAWTVDGARQLVAFLPDELDDLRSGIVQRFGSTTGGSQQD